MIQKTVSRWIFALATLLLPLGVAEQAFAMASGWAVNDQGRLRLVSSVDGVGDRQDIKLGIQFRMEPGWKIYWRSPGDAGYPPHLDWKDSQNIAAARIEWPAPMRFSVLGLETLGYEKEVILPLRVQPSEPGKPIALHADVSYLTCAEICVPHQEKLALKLPAAPAEPSHQANILARFASQVPGEGPRHGLSIGQVSLAPEGPEDIVLRVQAQATQPFFQPDLFIEGPEGAFFTKPEIELSGDRRSALLTVTGGGVPQAEFKQASLRLTLVDGGRAMEQAVETSLRADGPVLSLEGGSFQTEELLTILALAVLGGLILNLMPCVLPVLSIKLLKVVGHGGSNPRQVRAGFIASAAGILFSFLLLAGALIGLKNAGMAVGWGIQFQQPVFLTVLTVVLALFACNLVGLFEIRLPGRLADAASKQGHENSLSGHFMTGAFATLLATPCSAPFLGTAVGFALSRGTFEIVSVFTALALGLALPYLAVAAFPGLATRLPRPGPWMVVLRRVMAVALVVTAVWLMSIVHTLLGTDATIAIGALVLLVPAVLATRRLAGSRLGARAGLVVTVLVVAAVMVPVLREPVPAGLPYAKADSDWIPFDESEIARHVSEGKVVLVDITADWCITCQVNKTLVFDKGRVAELLGGGSIVAMQADWTKPDPEIARYLARFGRYGIPFNVVFGPRAPQGIVLPELLTEAAVLTALADASSDRSIVSR